MAVPECGSKRTSFELPRPPPGPHRLSTIIKNYLAVQQAPVTRKILRGTFGGTRLCANAILIYLFICLFVSLFVSLFVPV